VRYAIGSYQFAGYLPLWNNFLLSSRCSSPTARVWARTNGLPPYKRFYAGGPDTVRGFTEDTLGPVDTNGNPYGGNQLICFAYRADPADAGKMGDQRAREPVL
jgi:outer membrane protein insertion porin family